MKLYTESQSLFCVECFNPVLILSHLGVFLEGNFSSEIIRLIVEREHLASHTEPLEVMMFNEKHLYDISVSLKETREHCNRTGNPLSFLHLP